jgi:hypothetical protein
MEIAMRLKRYCVTVLDHWTPTQMFWTLEGAKKHLRKHKLSRANLFKWDGEAWCWMCGTRDLDPSFIKSPLAGF